ncbi:MAG: hypothetical protein KF685_12810 [Acidobacteria bacterium]|nr:hypothetical protein [Acidobacteriota bacterium]
MSIDQRFSPGDLLVFQLESGFGLLRLLGVDKHEEEYVWHVTAYADLFPDVDMAEVAAAEPHRLTVAIPFTSMTTRAFESTQVSVIHNAELTEKDIDLLEIWRRDPERSVSDRSVRLLLGLR